MAQHGALDSEPAANAHVMGVLVRAASHVMRCVQVDAGGVNDAVVRCHDAISAAVYSVCLELDEDNAYWPQARVAKLADMPGKAFFRLLAFAALAVAKALGTGAVTSCPWFSTLRRLLRCRLFGRRMQGVQRSSLALLVGALWQLSAPSLSRWSASLDDYLTLDELESLAGAFTGTKDCTDALLLHVLSSYEDVTRQSVQRVALVFGPTAAAMYDRRRVGNAQYALPRSENLVGEVDADVLADAMASVDAARMRRSVEEFCVHAADGAPPLERLAARICGLEDVVVGSEQNYDPRFVLRWLWAVLSAGCSVDHRRLVDTHALGMALVALSSAHVPTRKLAYYVLDLFYTQFSADNSGWFSGKTQCLLLLDSLRNAITLRTSDEFPQLPFTTTLFAATSLPLMLRPDHAMFSLINRFLLKQPWLEMDEIPLVRVTLCAVADARRQRVHVLRLVALAARAIDMSWRWFARSSGVSALLALMAAPLGDVVTAKSAVTLLLHLSGRENPKALVRHVAKNRFALLPWISHQVALEANVLLSVSHMQSPYTPAVRAALVNMTALLRVVLRVVANFPLVEQRGEDRRGVNKFWVVRSASQANAVGQSAVLDMLRHV
ncbi:hypothetical protein LPJ73_006063, partial [Coemansia sp. RSA 2703]